MPGRNLNSSANASFGRFGRDMAEQNIVEKTALKTALRDAFGAFASGVTVVTARDSHGMPVGFTANSFTSVSLDPPLLLICLGKSSSNYATFCKTDSFAVNILAADQAEISGRFATPGIDRYAGTEWREGHAGAPLIEGVAAWFDCIRHNVIDAGDHIILIGEVAGFERSTGAPLIYLQGQYLEAPVPAGAAAETGANGSMRAGCILGQDDRILMQRDSDGWRLPMGASKGSFRAARGDLEDRLGLLGVMVEWNVLYSVFDAPEDEGTWVFFHGHLAGDLPSDGDLQFFALDTLPLDKVAKRPIRSMLRRYAAEARTGDFGVYVDAAQHIGHVARFAGAPTPWEQDFKVEDINQ